MNRLRTLLVDGFLLALPLGGAAFLLVKVIELLSKLLAPARRLLPEGRWFGIAAVEIAAIVVLLILLLILGVFAVPCSVAASPQASRTSCSARYRAISSSRPLHPTL